MNFLERFKGKTSTIDKKGIDGVVMSKALPIEKDQQMQQQLQQQVYEQGATPKPFLQRVSTEQFLQQTKLPELSSHQFSAPLEKERSLTMNTTNGSDKQSIKIFTNIRSIPSNSVRSESPQCKVSQCPSPLKHKSSFNSQFSAISGNTQLSGGSQISNNQNSAQFSPMLNRGSRSNTHSDLMKRQSKEFEQSILSGLVQPSFQASKQQQQSLQQQQYFNYQQELIKQKQQQQEQSQEQYQIFSSNSRISNPPPSQGSDYSGSKSCIHLQPTESFKVKSPRLRDSPIKGGFGQRVFQLGSQSPLLKSFNAADIRSHRSTINSSGSNTNTNANTNIEGNSVQGDSQLLFNGNFQVVPPGMSQIIVPNDYELIAVPKVLGLSHSQPFNQEGLRSIPTIPKLPLLPFKSMSQHQKQEQTPIRLLGYSPMNTDSSPSGRANLGFSQVLNKQNLINSAKNILESRQKHPAPSFKYELDLMEEKHRDIIENLDKLKHQR